MRQKLLLELAGIAISFFAVWFLLSQIDFVSAKDVDIIGKRGEKKLAELILEGLDHQNRDFNAKLTMPYIDSIARKICEANGVVFDSIKIHIIHNSEVNAFALPDRNLVLYTGFLEDAKNAEEIAGVIGHELGHIEKQHVMKKLVKEIGITMLMVITGGSENFEVIKEAGRVLSSTAFDRSQEREADEYAVEAMIKAKIDIEPLGNFLFRMSTVHDMPDELVWISTHPDSKERAAEIFKRKKDLDYKPQAVIDTPWADVVKTLEYKQSEDGD